MGDQHLLEQIFVEVELQSNRKGQIRTANFGDAAKIAEIHVQCWKETYANILNQEILDQLDVQEKLILWQAITRSLDHQLLVYIEDQKIKGFLDGYLNPENNVAEIRAFYLLQDIQKQGVGREMFQCFYDYVFQKRYQFIRLEVFNKNPSRFFYEKIGAELIGEAELPEFGEGITELIYQWEI